MAKVDFSEPTSHGRPLWIVYGEKCFPSVLCAELRPYDAQYRLLPVGQRGEVVCIWGYSVYRGKPGFRTLGISFVEWAARSTFGPHCFSEQEEALALLRKVTSPKA